MALNCFSNAMYEILPSVELSKPLALSGGEILIHAPGFEDRTLAVLNDFDSGNGTQAILLDYRPYNPNHKLAQVRDGLREKGFCVPDQNIVKYDRFKPADFEDRLCSRLRCAEVRTAVVDVSTMSKLEIMLVLHVCKEMNLNVHLLYSEAKSYGPSKEQFEKAKAENEIHRPTIQVFTGIHGVVRVDSLASIAMQGQSTAALVFMSFNDALTQMLLNTVYPGRLFLINGRPPVHSWREEATAWIHDQVRREWPDDNPIDIQGEDRVPLPIRTVSTLDYRETVSLLVQLYWDLSANHRILLAPAGSKLQSVGCYIVKALHPDIHIEYPSPEGFVSFYSNGIGQRWSINLGNLAELVSKIHSFEIEKFLEIRSSSPAG